MIELRQSYLASAKVISSIAVQAGDLIVVGLYQDGVQVETSCADNGGNTYEKAAEEHITDASGCGIYAHYAIAVANGTLTITGTMAGSGYNSIFVHVYSGNFSLATALHASNTKGETSRSTNHTGAEVTTTNPNALLFGFWGEASGSGTISENGAGFTERREDAGTATYDRIVASTGAYSDAVISTLSTALASILLAFQEVPAGSGPRKPLVRASGSGLEEVQLSSSDLSDGPFSGLGNQREILTAARTYYVRTNGNDANDGLSNTSGGAFLTIQKAIDVVCDSLDMRGHQVTIQVADGTYSSTPTAVMLRKYVGRLAPWIIGNTTTPSNCILSVATHAVRCSDSFWYMRGFQITTTNNGIGILSEPGGIIRIANIVFAVCSGQHLFAKGGRIYIDSAYTISGGCAHHMVSEQGGIISNEGTGRLITITGTPNLGVFALAQMRGSILYGGNTYSGSATGTRYFAATGGFIQAGTATPPGNVAGSITTNGYFTA